MTNIWDVISLRTLQIINERHDGPLFDKLGDTSHAPNGAPYVVIQGVGGMDEAIDAFKAYVTGKAGTLYWRALPELRDDGKPHSRHFYMRLVVG